MAGVSHLRSVSSGCDGGLGERVQEFLKSVDELVTLRQNASKLRAQLMSFNTDLQSSGATVLQKVRTHDSENSFNCSRSVGRACAPVCGCVVRVGGERPCSSRSLVCGRH